MKVFLYDEGVGEELNIEEIARYLRQKLGKAEIELRGNLFSFNLSRGRAEDYAGKIASSKIPEVGREIVAGQELLYGEIEYEKRRISGKTRAFGILYDGFHLQRVFRQMIPGEELRLDFAHIIFTNRLLATWDDSNKKYHLRTSIYGIPSLVSTTGLVEAPAKPRDYYLIKQQYESLGKDLTELKDRFKGSFIDYEDKRLTEVAKGYAMQAVFYSLTGNPFCQDKGCRLYNAHWQEELIFAQLESDYEFCPRHSRLLEKA
ncbi:MAG: hypothetical protein HY325_06965 [Chloroflexi bacterium]|nr:hypothetical protein [Chloroflexota bacterium]